MEKHVSESREAAAQLVSRVAEGGYGEMDRLYPHACIWLPPACLLSVVFKRYSVWEPSGLSILHAQWFNNAHSYHIFLFCFAFLHFASVNYHLVDDRVKEMHIPVTVRTLLSYAPLSSLSFSFSIWNSVCMCIYAPVCTYIHMYIFYPLLKSIAVKIKDYNTYNQVNWVRNLELPVIVSILYSTVTFIYPKTTHPQTSEVCLS